jgi:hypothetical protein
MGCCGQKREAWREHTLPRAEHVAPPLPELTNPVAVRYLGASSLLVKGPSTGQVYLFAGGDSSLFVDERDLAGLGALGQFVVTDLGPQRNK